MQYFKTEAGDVWAFEDNVKNVHQFDCVPKNITSITEEEAINISKSKTTNEEVK